MESLKEKIGASLLVAFFTFVLLYATSTNQSDPIIVISYSIMFTLLFVAIWTGDKITKLDIWTAKIMLPLMTAITLLVKKCKQWRERRQTMKALRDDDNPSRVTKRRKRAIAIDAIKPYAFFISIFIVFPLAIISLGIWRMQFNASVGWLLIIIAILCSSEL